MKSMWSLLIAMFLLQVPSAGPIASAAHAATGQAPVSESSDPGWPRTMVVGGATVLFYQPQISKWQDNQIQAYAAVSIQNGSTGGQTYGVVYFTARTEVDKVNRLVTLAGFKIAKADFPSAPDKAASYATMLQRAGDNKVKTISLDRLLAELAVTEAEQQGSAQDLNNEPPRIIFSERPAVLVLIDGEPALRPLAESNLQRIINTRALIIVDQKKSTCYLSLMDGWVTAPTPEGPWAFTENVPSDVKKAKQKLEAAGQVDLLNQDESGAPETEGGTTPSKPESLKDRLRDGTFPVVYVSTVPAELLISQGAPQLKPISGTSLLYVANTDDDIFMNTADQRYYILISGRWFAAKSTGGPWQFVAGSALPADFSRIPDGHPKASVLASTPGTTAAREAAISNSIPQTATVTRSEASLSVTYDGEPQFRRVEGTDLSYAVNTSTPVIEVNSHKFCAVDSGVWFEASSPTGPWSPATSVPASIYSIPPKSPLHYVTYVRIYDYTPEVIYCGYTPGYYGTVVSADGIVVYGTGWYYPPYIGTWWIGWPWTYGCGAGFAWSPWWGWSFDFGIGYYYPFWRPWWGPLGWGWPWRHWHPRWGWGRWGGVAGLNAYGRWGHSATSRTRAAWARPSANDTSWRRPGRTGVLGPIPNHGTRPGNPTPPGNTKAGANTRGLDSGRNRDVIAGKDGKVYRYDDKTHTWQERNGKGWKTASPSSDQRSLDKARQSREQGNQRSGNFRITMPAGGGARPSPTAPRPSGGARPGGSGAPRPGGAGRRGH